MLEPGTMMEIVESEVYSANTPPLSIVPIMVVTDIIVLPSAGEVIAVPAALAVDAVAVTAAEADCCTAATAGAGAGRVVEANCDEVLTALLALAGGSTLLVEAVVVVREVLGLLLISTVEGLAGLAWPLEAVTVVVVNSTGCPPQCDPQGLCEAHFLCNWLLSTSRRYSALIEPRVSLKKSKGRQ